MSPDAEDASTSPEPGIDQDSNMMADDKAERASTEERSPSGNGSNSETKPSKTNSKDPGRQKRKKARRACFACQRAHLTCGDERPCNRCIKRGLQDQCHDGVRKKAKYLHDAPADALMPSFHGNYQINGPRAVASAQAPNTSMSQGSNYMSSTPSTTFAQYGQVSQPGPMGPPVMENDDPLMGGFVSQQNVETPPQFQQSTPTQQISPAMNNNNNDIEHTQPMSVSGSQNFDPAFIDPNDSSLFNFDLSSLNFGNHYGALEFGMLGHMSSGAVGTPEVEAMNPMGGQSHHGGLPFDGPPGFTNPAGNFGSYSQNFNGWQHVAGHPRQGSASSIWASQNNGLDAFAIGEASLTGASPHSQGHEHNGGYNTSPESQFSHQDQITQQPDLLRHSLTQQQHQQHRKQIPPFVEPVFPRKRRRDPSEIYKSVQAPYPYTQGFHALTAFLQRRFPSKKTLRIAKALASIRPSFISCNKSLTNDDLIFMEQSFQRTLYEYEDFVNHYATPTIICRRTGEIAAVSKEFTLVTGWRRDVVLGKESNLNINTGGNASGTGTGTSSRGAQTPRLPNVEIDPGRTQPVFLAELMDEDSVVKFYEDFAELAFGASRTAIVGQTCALLKYKTRDDLGWDSDEQFTADGKRIKTDAKNESNAVKAESGMHALGGKEGKVECSMCWTVKRDVFDIPMLIVMNFLPII